MSARDLEARHLADEKATVLGRAGQSLDGAVNRHDDHAARERFLVALGGTRPGSSAWKVVLAAALVGILTTALVVRFGGMSPSLQYGVSGPAIAQGEWLDVPADRGAVALRFSEGTEIELGPGSQGKVSDVSAEGATVVLGSGALQARVVHRPKAKWTVEAGPYAIEVTGTAFDVGWSKSGERLEVKLHDGSVIVRGPALQDGIRVAAGQRLVAHALTGGAELSSLFEAETAARPRNAVEPAPSASPSASPSSVRAEPSEPSEPGAAPVHAAPTWSELVSLGNFKAVLEAASARGVDQTLNHGSLRELVALSDAARYAGERDLARRGLLAQRSRFAGSAESHAAAFVLGRMADDAGSSSQALSYYDGYLGEAPRGAFAAEATGRRLVVLVKLGNKAAAHDAAEAYVKRFPHGAHAAYARDMLRGP